MGYFVISRRPSDREFIFGFMAENHEQILASESYTTKQNCENGIEAVKRIAPHDSSYERSDLPANYRFKMVSGNNQTVARSSEGYTTAYNRERAIDIVKGQAPSARVIDKS